MHLYCKNSFKVKVTKIALFPFFSHINFHPKYPQFTNKQKNHCNIYLTASSASSTQNPGFKLCPPNYLYILSNSKDC